jgi:signal transduction histidine kinase
VNASDFGRVFNPLPDGFLLLTSGGRIEAASRAAARLLGMDSIAQGTSLADMAAGEADNVLQYLQRCARSGSLLPGALALKTGNGVVRLRAQGAVVQPGPEPLLLLRLQPQESASQQFLALNEKIVQLNREINERRRAQEQLQEQALELEYVAAELEQTVEELQHQSEAAAVAQAQAELAASRFQTLAEAGAALATSLDHRATLQELAAAAVRTIADYCIAYVVNADGRLERVAGAHADPTRAVLLERLIAHYPEERGGVAGIILNGQAVLAAEVTDDMLVGTAADDAHLRLLRELGPTSSIVAPLQARGRTLGALAVARTAGHSRYTKDDLALVEELADRAALALDNARLFHEAQRANRAKSVFLATMSHELRTPLNAIVGYADLLDAEVTAPLEEGQRQHLFRIRSAADHLRTIIEEVLAFARIEANKERLRVEAVDVTALVRDTAELVRPSLAERDLALNIECDADVRITTDPGKLRQILLNLLGNAIKFTERGGIDVTVARGAGACIDVRDTGIGIPADEVQRIFEPFWQVDQGMTRHAGGTGLGLTVSLRLAHLMGGDIEVHSEPGRGSTFTLVLPESPPASD